MTFTGFLAVLLLLAGTWLDAPVAIVLAIVVLLLEVVRAVWSRTGLTRIVYRRHLARDRITWGEEIATTIETWNRQALPLSWLRAEDEATPGVVVRERPLVIGGRGGRVLRNAWTLAPHERVRRRFHVTGERRGVYELGPVGLSIGDLFAREAAHEQRRLVDRFLVRPRSVATAALHPRDTWGGEQRAIAGLSEDPSRFAGVRPYAPGDPLRRMHARASARTGVPVVKRFEPSRDREVLLVLDVQTGPEAGWRVPIDEDEVEALFVVAASTARSLVRGGSAVGLAAAGFHGAESRFAELAISEAPGQLDRILDLLARLASQPSAPFERLLGRVARTVRPGTTVVIVTARDASPFLGWLRRIERAGARVLVVACGATGIADARRVRRLGIAAQSVRLDGPWQTATELARTG
jgi:uncharacterized protein (DUF58 family)